MCTEKQWLELASCMNDEIRERVCDELSPCTEKEFLERYLELDPDFKEISDSYLEAIKVSNELD